MVSVPWSPAMAVPTVAALSRAAPVLPAATPTTVAPSAPAVSLSSTLPVAGPNSAAARLSLSATAVGTSSTILTMNRPASRGTPSSPTISTENASKLTLPGAWSCPLVFCSV